jgi:hypothetical protein
MTALVLGAALLVLFYRLLLGEVFFWGLPALQFVPWRDAAFELLRADQLPLWTSYNGAGAPLLANYQSALLYPASWLGLFLPLAWSMSLTAVAHLALAGGGMWALTGRLGAPALGRALSALAFGLTSYLVARLGTYPMIQAAAWLPWLVWAAHGWLTGASARAGALLAVFTALQLLAGHAQTAWYSLLLVALYSLWLVAAGPARGQVRRLLGTGLALALGAGVAALQLIPTAELLLSSQRSGGVDYDFAMNFSFGWARALNFLSPVVFGTPADGSYLESGFYFEYAVYIGLIPLVSAVAAVTAWWGSRRQPTRHPALASVPFWALVALVGFVFALGPTTPLFPFLYRFVPTFDLFQAPARWSLWTVFSLSLLSALGVTAWGRTYRLRRWTRRIMAGCVAVLLLAGIGLLALPPEGGAFVLLRAMLAAALLGLAAGWLTLRQPEATQLQRRVRWVTLVLLVVAADLVWANWGQNPTAPSAFFERSSSVSAAGRADWPSEVEAAVKFEEFFRVDDYRVAAERWADVRASGLPNLNLLDRRPLLDNFDPLIPGAFADFARLLDATPTDARAGLYVAAGVGAIYTGANATTPTAEAAARAWLVPSVCWHAAETDLNRALLDPARLATQVQILGDGPCPDAPPAAPPSSVLLGDEGSRVELRVQAAYDGWLVLADTDYPGWTAAVDGAPVPIFRANGPFRAVQVPPGEHVVTFRYTPRWLSPAALTSLASLLVLLAWLLKSGRANSVR